MISKCWKYIQGDNPPSAEGGGANSVTPEEDAILDDSQAGNSPSGVTTDMANLTVGS